MSRRAYAYLGSSALLLLALAGCGRGLWNSGERASWRHEAEVNCLKSGEVKLGAGAVQIEPIEGPGMCGADFPLKVSALGVPDATPMSYGEDVRPPAAIPGGSSNMPNWPVNDQRYAPTQPVQSAPLQTQPVQQQTIRGETMRWVPGPQGVEIHPSGTPARYAPADRPMQAPVGRPMPLGAPAMSAPQEPQEPPEADDVPDDAVLPNDRAPRTQPAYNQPRYQPQPQRPLPPLGPARGPSTPAAMAALNPPATLACPLVSALDRWVTDGVQPAAQHWFGTPVVTIKQIGSYSCREMVGAGGDFVSEHAFGNALDVAGFTLADGRTITVKDGWHGSPEEQGFLHDVQLYACETFTTVLAPGYNVYHYDHIHVDLMRRESGRRPCRPDAIPGEVAAAKARSTYAAKHERGPAYTGSIGTDDKLPVAVPGADGVADDKVVLDITSTKHVKLTPESLAR
jgi:hypothetical protein